MQVPAFIGNSAQIQRVRIHAIQTAAADVTAIVTGESGTGKEVTACFIHAHSRRAQRPFVAVNCAALSETLIDSELFGHERGAFTGALSEHAGLFEEAHSGTLLLDEVSEIRPASQAKLLRVLQESEVRRVGGSRVRAIDVRVIATSNLNLQQAVASGVFREDLYYRLSIIEIAVPPLRERLEDIPALAHYLLLLHAPRYNSNLRRLSPSAVERLQAHVWPGNVRELHNVLVRAIVFADRQDVEVLPRHLLSLPENEPVEGQAQCLTEEALDLRMAIAHLRQRYVKEALRRTNGCRTEAAEILGISRRALYDLLSE